MAEGAFIPQLNRRALLAGIAATALSNPAAAGPPAAQSLRNAMNAPGVGMVARTKGVTTASFAGVRARGFDAPIGADDLWHLGSLTKSMTATLAMRLAEQGRISLSDTIGERLGALGPVATGLQDATLLMLLHHRAGLMANIPNSLAIELQRAETTTPLPDLRQRYAAEMIKEAGGPTGDFLYANAGYVTAAAMMEVATGETWETLIARELFAPLTIKSAGFGPPGLTTQTPDQPWGHNGQQPMPPGPAADNIAALNPAGRVHMSLGDLGRYLAAHADRHPLLSADGWATLHRKGPGGGPAYAAGWILPTETVWLHNGSNTFWYAIAGFNASGDTIAIIVNQGAGGGLPAAIERPALNFLRNA